MIKVENLNLSIGDNKILESLNFDIFQGKFTALLGPNGAGKSSLLKCLTGLQKPSSGEVIFCGKKLADYSVSSLSKMRAVMSQNFEVNFPFTVEEIVMMGRSPYINKKESLQDKKIVADCLNKVDMTEFAERNFSSLSGGEKQRVQIARVLAQLVDGLGDMGGKHLFLDEPTSALDLKHQNDLMKLVKSLVQSQKLTVFAIVHDINLAARFADSIIMLSEGKILSEGKSDKVLTKRNLEKLYKTNIEIHESADKKIFSAF